MERTTHGPHVLIVEDDPDIRNGIAEALALEQYEVSVARHGAEGLAAARSGAPDLVLLDLAMPVLDGAGFLAERRGDPALSRIPVVVLTAGRNVDVPGCEVLAKPFELDALLAVVARCAGRPDPAPAASER